jgi:hypothetical protein
MSESPRPPTAAYTTGLSELPCVAQVRLHPPAPRRVHRGEVRVRHDDLVPQLLQAAGHPLALSRGLDGDLSPLPPADVDSSQSKQERPHRPGGQSGRGVTISSALGATSLAALSARLRARTSFVLTLPGASSL